MSSVYDVYKGLTVNKALAVLKLPRHDYINLNEEGFRKAVARQQVVDEGRVNKALEHLKIEEKKKKRPARKLSLVHFCPKLSPLYDLQQKADQSGQEHATIMKAELTGPEHARMMKVNPVVHEAFQFLFRKKAAMRKASKKVNRKTSKKVSKKASKKEALSRLRQEQEQKNKEVCTFRSCSCSGITSIQTPTTHKGMFEPEETPDSIHEVVQTDQEESSSPNNEQENRQLDGKKEMSQNQKSCVQCSRPIICDLFADLFSFCYRCTPTNIH